jgi:hypothetical protein
MGSAVLVGGWQGPCLAARLPRLLCGPTVVRERLSTLRRTSATVGTPKSNHPAAPTPDCRTARLLPLWGNDRLLHAPAWPDASLCTAQPLALTTCTQRRRRQSGTHVLSRLCAAGDLKGTGTECSTSGGAGGGMTHSACKRADGALGRHVQHEQIRHGVYGDHRRA